MRSASEWMKDLPEWAYSSPKWRKWVESIQADALDAAAKVCDDLHDVPFDPEPTDVYDVGVNVGGLKRCETIAKKIRALAPEGER